MFGNGASGPARERAPTLSLGMTRQLRYAPQSLTFDPRLENELVRWEAATQRLGVETFVVLNRRSPFDGYTRVLTPGGGILISYTDRDDSIACTVLRVFAWLVTTGLGGWLLLTHGQLDTASGLIFLAALALLTWLIVRRKLKASHAVEIRADCMVVDGKDIFWADEIGENWPKLQKKDKDSDRMVIAGICGTRFIEYMTANRFDECDRTPEVLAEDLKIAMEQLWGRREVTFTTARS
jgi:hypothetical protein